MPPQIKIQEVPYDQAGNLLHHHSDKPFGEAMDWRSNDPFHATLQLDEVRSGRSAKYVILTPPGDTDNRQFPMFIADLLVMLKENTVKHGIVSGRWCARKRGQNYGLVWLGPQ